MNHWTEEEEEALRGFCYLPRMVNSCTLMLPSEANQKSTLRQLFQATARLTGWHPRDLPAAVSFPGHHSAVLSSSWYLHTCRQLTWVLQDTNLEASLILNFWVRALPALAEGCFGQLRHFDLILWATERMTISPWRTGVTYVLTENSWGQVLYSLNRSLRRADQRNGHMQTHIKHVMCALLSKWTSTGAPEWGLKKLMLQQ